MNDGRAFAGEIMRRYNFRSEAIADILAHVDVELHDPDSVRGGGMVLPVGGQRWIVVLYTGQHEACVHECSHVWWFLNQNDTRVAALIGAMLHQAELTAHPRFRQMRELCRLYRDGDGRGWPGMWVGPPYDRWNADEIFAGLASATMGDVRLYPPELRTIFERMYNPRELVYLPAVMAYGPPRAKA